MQIPMFTSPARLRPELDALAHVDVTFDLESMTRALTHRPCQWIEVSETNFERLAIGAEWRNYFAPCVHIDHESVKEEASLLAADGLQVGVLFGVAVFVGEASCRLWHSRGN